MSLSARIAPLARGRDGRWPPPPRGHCPVGAFQSRSLTTNGRIRPAGPRGRPARTAPGPECRTGRRGRDRPRGQRRPRLSHHARGRSCPRRGADVAVHLRTRQGRTARPDARHGLPADAARRPVRHAVARAWPPSPTRTANCSPGTPGLPRSRPPLGPGLMAKYEHELQAFEGLGLDDVEMDAALTFLLGFVQAAACSTAEAAAARQDAAVSEEQWWAANAPCSPGSSTRQSTPPPPASPPPQAPPTARPMTPTTPTPSACSASSTASGPNRHQRGLTCNRWPRRVSDRTARAVDRCAGVVVVWRWAMALVGRAPAAPAPLSAAALGDPGRRRRT
jgi:hypothetical protein